MLPPLDAFERLQQGTASISLDAYALLELTGDDRLEWLQGQVTNDVRDLTPGQSLSFCFCEPTGQILAPVDAWAQENRILMAVPRELATPVLERINRMTILEDVAARDLTPGIVGAFTMVQPTPGTIVLPSRRLGLEGWDGWGEVSAPTVLSEDAFEAARIETGVPRWGVDFGPRTLPAEMGPAFEVRYISYSKGCYTGQEVLMRMHARGHTNKTWVGLVAEEPLSVGTEVLLAGKPVGAVSSAAPSPTCGWVGAATLRNEATVDGTKVRVGDAEAEVRQMPIRRAV